MPSVAVIVSFMARVTLRQQKAIFERSLNEADAVKEKALQQKAFALDDLPPPPIE